MTGAGPVNPVPESNPGPGDPTNHNVLLTFPTRIPIAAGQMVGVSFEHEGGSFIEPVMPAVASSTEWTYGCFGGGCGAVPAAGKSADATIIKEQWLAMNARVEPDNDHDGYGDETQNGSKAPVVTVVPPPTVVPSKQAAKKKCKKGKRLKRGKCVKKKHKKHKHKKH